MWFKRLVGLKSDLQCRFCRFVLFLDQTSVRQFLKRLTILLMVLTISPANAQTIFSDLLTARDWPQYRSGMAVLNLPALRKMMKVYLANENALISIRYPGGDAGNAWAGELREWLISLGVPSADLELLPGSRSRDALTLEVFRNPVRITQPSAETEKENES